MSGDGEPLLLHLYKIPAEAAASDQSLAQAMELLWSTRRTGLAPAQKTHLRSLLALPAAHDLDPVVAGLRLLIRKSVQENLTREGIQKLFPPNISIELKRILLMLLQKFHRLWKEEASRDQPLWQRTSNQVRVNAPVALRSFSVSELPSTLWPRQDDATTYSNNNNNNNNNNDDAVGSSIPSHADSNLPHTGSTSLNRENGFIDNLANLPRLKSMTWTMHNRHSAPANRVAIITLKLQDYTKSPSGEIEVKFQISKDTLEATLRWMACFSEQLSNLAALSGQSSDMLRQ